MKTLAAISVLLTTLTTGCVSWPEAGNGGLAELRPDNFRTVEADGPIGPEHGLRFDLELTARHLDMLVLEGAELCFPATVVQAKQREARIRRELAGKLDYAAANDLLIQRKVLQRLEQQLDYVQQHNICQIPQHVRQEKRPGDLAKQIAELLNADNQFAHDSFELNPKYVGRLAKASQLLQQAPLIQLKVIGYADDTGQDNYNQSLSLKRAQKVARYLQVMGVDANRMQISALGEQHPLFQGKTPEIRLVNRSVSIEVISQPTANDSITPAAKVINQIK
ncbi:OmpA family protein [Saccharobesus litoralis]|uniref:OmpA family protein n=1 Tax=Saccharobesus litoralis TaxID=2172099 RepID=A0A2S0VMG8_9ALTE|nr:OmpA family protein [Saccharobesus litoralis]AWB65372.1 OmpA family protein [Saccharobesus litoralis]